MESMDYKEFLHNIRSSVQLLDNEKSYTRILKCTSNIVKGIQEKELSISQLVEDLEDLLTNTDVEKRLLGVSVLSNVLRHLPNDFLDSKETALVVEFMLSKVGDNYRVVPEAIDAIRTLCNCKNLCRQLAPRILEAIFNVSCQQQQQQDRLNIYTIFKVLFHKCTSELLGMGERCVRGIISAIDGERDPTNLKALFEWMPLFLKTIHLNAFMLEEAFDVLSCYFPVDFRSTTDDGEDNIRDELARALSPNLCAIPDFGPLCVPLALEKLEAALTQSKLDALQLLRDGCTTFLADVYKEYWYQILDELQKHIFDTNFIQNSSDADEEQYDAVSNSCLQTLNALTAKLSVLPESDFNDALQQVYDVAISHLHPEARHFIRATHFIKTCAKANTTSANYLAVKVSALYQNVYSMSTSIPHKILIMNAITDFLAEAYLPHFGHLGPFDFFKKLCLGLLDADSSTIRKHALQGIEQMIQFLHSNERHSLYQHLHSIAFLNMPDSHSLYTLMHLLCTDYGEEFYAVFVKKLPLHQEIVFDAKPMLNILFELANEQICSQFAIETCLKHLENTTNDEAIITLKGFRQMLTKYPTSECIHRNLQDCEAIKRIIISWKRRNCVESDDDLVAVIQAYIAQTNPSRQLHHIKELMHSTVTNQEDIATITICYGLLSCIHLGTLFKCDEVIENYYQTALNGSVRAQHLLANLINKWLPDSTFNFLNSINTLDKTHIKIKALIVKALFMRNHEQCVPLLYELIASLGDNVTVVDCFDVLMNDSYDCLSERCYCIRSPLYQQKLFVFGSKKLLELYNETSNQSYIEAYGSWLPYTPTEIVMLHLNEHIKVLLKCLEVSKRPQTLLAVLNILHKASDMQEKCVTDNLAPILDIIKGLCETRPSMPIKISALQCLQSIASTGNQIYSLLPHKDNILKILEIYIDDKKRLVRKEAAEAKFLWSLIGLAQ